MAIGVCTFRRPAGLRQLLNALAAQKLDRLQDAQLSLIVIDNDDEPTAKDIVQSFEDKPWTLIYRHEPKRGLVHARNALLDAVPERCRWLAFIDDDEVPVIDWLQSLVMTAQTFEVPIVAGPVEPIFQQDPPLWVKRGDFFRRAPEADGTPTRWISTQNALVDVQAIKTHGWRFDMEFNRSGGEDEHFFCTALAAGCKAVVSHDALVHDDIPPERLEVAWLFQRHLRMGTTLAKIDMMRGPKVWMFCLRMMKSGVRMLIGVARLIISPLFGKAVTIKAWLEIARAIGAASGLLGLKLKLYG